MKTIKNIMFFLFLLLGNGCIVQFVPDIEENQDLLVVEGMVTDQNRRYTVKLSRSVNVGSKQKPAPAKNGIVSITDDLNNRYLLVEKTPGIYLTDSLTFRGEIGRKYTLHINYLGLNYNSTPMEMKPVPPVDSIYYENEVRNTDFEGWYSFGLQLYLDTFDPTSTCNYYRWEYVETWKFSLPFPVQNKICYVSANSNRIYIKNTSVLSEDRVTRFPLNYVSDETDRLTEKYSLLVNQYSVNEEEYTYWEKLQKVSESVGGLYDVTPMSIMSNIACIEDPMVKVLGYFSVSAVSSKRIFIDGIRGNFPDLYSQCPNDTLSPNAVIPNLNTSVWIINRLPQIVTTLQKGCADCTVRGTTIKPAFWIEP
jgi:hypothetical protein